MSHKISVYLIDVNAEKLTNHLIDNENIDEIYSLLKAEQFNVIDLENGDAIYFDEEGLFRDAEFSCIETGKGYAKGFMLNDEITIIGNGLIIGTNEETGDSMSCISTPFDFVNKLKFCFIKTRD